MPLMNHWTIYLFIYLFIYLCLCCSSFSSLSWHSLSGPNSTKVIEKILIQRSLLPNTRWQNVTQGTEANVTFSFRLLCNKNYFGNSCSKVCVPRHDSLGHYSCDDKGDKVCLQGWTGAFCDSGMSRNLLYSHSYTPWNLDEGVGVWGDWFLCLVSTNVEILMAITPLWQSLLDLWDFSWMFIS